MTDCGFNFIPIPSGDSHIEIWRLQPTENNPVISEGAKGIKAIEEICSKLEYDNNLWSNNSYENDYPSIPTDLTRSCYGKGPITNRPMWIIAGVPFFRRYNDDWNAIVFVGIQGTYCVNWDRNIGTEKLCKLRDLINSKNISTITKEEILNICK